MRRRRCFREDNGPGWHRSRGCARGSQDLRLTVAPRRPRMKFHHRDTEFTEVDTFLFRISLRVLGVSVVKFRVLRFRSSTEMTRRLLHRCTRNNANIGSIMEATHDGEADILAGVRGEQSDHQFNPLF